jgi:hypothetical protein
LTSPFEDSSPGAASLPAIITPQLFERPEAPELNDVGFSNVVDPDSGVSVAGVGALLTATFAVPLNYTGAARVFMFAIPDTFANGFDVIPTEIGRGVTLNITIPEPASVVLLACAGWVGGARRRRS